MAYWTFDQNNSGGSFVFDERRGLTHYVVIEADSREEAISRAEDIGIYFNGCSDGRDCSCCGDRWHTPWNEAGDDAPEVYGQNVRANGGYKPSFGKGWMAEGREVCIHPKDGPMEWFGTISEAKPA